MASAHAKLNPSSAHRWTSCTASVREQEGFANTTSEASRLGTCQHTIAAECLESGGDPFDYVGRTMLFPSEKWGVDDGMNCQHSVTVTDEMADACLRAVSYVRELVAMTGAQMIVEQRVPLGHITGEADGFGTSDVILLTDDTIISLDFKMGRSRVTAYDVAQPAVGDAPPVLQMNLQLAMYALGALEKYGLLGDFKFVRSVIVQPYLGNPVSEYQCEISELLRLGAWLSEKAEETRSNPQYQPSADNCFFCRAKHSCAARQQLVLETAVEGFDDIAHAPPRAVGERPLGHLHQLVPMIRDWCDDIEDKLLADLKAGKQHRDASGVRYKLVEGRKGNKQWSEPETVARRLLAQGLPLNAVYKTEVQTPAAIEALTKAKRGKDAREPLLAKDFYDDLREMIVQADGKPIVVPETDPRPELNNSDGFGEVQLGLKS